MAQPTTAIAAREILSHSRWFSLLPDEAHEQLIARLEPCEVSAGAVVVREGEDGDHYFLIASGEAEVWSAKGRRRQTLPSGRQDGEWFPDPRHHTLLGRLGAGDGFGELALLLGGKRRATVRAVTDLVLYRLDRETFTRTVNQHRGLAMALEEEMTLRSVVNLLGQDSPFSTLPPEGFRWLALRLQPVHYETGQEIVRQGETADAFYIVRAGNVEVVVQQPDGTEHRIDLLDPGAPFGEQALVTGQPRSATVRALAPTEVLRLSRADFEEVVQRYRERGNYFIQLTLQRQRPQRIEHWTMERQEGRDGAAVYILKDTKHHRYVKLLEQGAFLWDLMDGQHTVRELTVAFFTRYHRFGLDEVMGVMMQLHMAGFVRIQGIDRSRVGEMAELSSLQRLGLRLMPWLIRYFALPDLDGLVTALYRYLLRPLYFRPAQIFLFVATIAGAMLFVRYLITGDVQLQGASFGNLALFTGVGFIVQGLLHEVAHAVTCKHHGREVHRAGVGWYFFLPVAFVDTSDIWLAGKWARATVAFAGPYANFLLSGSATLLIPLITDPTAQMVLFNFATTGYILGITNLNPLLAFDGYYVLMDLLDVPNLRAKALAFLGTLLWRVRRTTHDARLTRIFAVYGILTLAYTVVVAILVLMGYQNYVRGAVGRVLPPLTASLLGWAIAGFMSWLILFQAWTDLRKGVQDARQRTQRTTGG